MAEYTISKIELPNGDICNIKDTWRGIQDNLTSSSNTTESLSAKQGYLLANGSARDSTKVSKSGDTMTSSLTIIKAGECGVEVNNTQSTNPNQVAFIVGQSGNGGIFSRKHSKWIVYADASGNVVLNGNAETATAFSAAKSVALTGDVTGSASSTGGWSVVTTIKSSVNLTGTPTLTNTPTAGDNSKKIATTEFVMNAFTANDAMLFKGVVNVDSDLPATHYQGWTYKVATAGTYANKVCEVGDMIVCVTDGTAANNDHWAVIQNNVNGAVFKGANSFTDGDILLADGTNGKVKDSGIKFITTTANKFLKDTGNWAQVDWEDLTGKPSTFSPSAHTHNTLESYASIGSSTTSHADALSNWFGANKSTAPRNKLISFYSSTSSNGSYYIGYFLNGYADNPYGGFFIAHYDNPYYVGISNGTYTQKRLLTNIDTYAANSNGTAVSVARNTDTTIATINGVDVKIKIPASDNTWRPIGTGATDAAAGNHTHNYAGSSSAGGAANSANKLNQTATTALNSFTDSTSFIYTAAGGGNTITDKPTDVDAFGCFSFKTATGWYGQLLMSSNTASGIYWRTAISLSGDWKKLLDSNNYTSYTVTKTGSGASGTWGINITGNAAKASALTNISTNDAASNSDTKRYIWICYDDNTTGRPAHTSNLTYQTSTNTLFTPKISIGIREVTSSPSSEITSDRIIIIPYFHTGGPWKISSADNGNDAFLKLFYGTTELIKIKHDGSFMNSLKANITGSSASCTGNAATATAFSAAKSVALTGDVTGSSSSTGGWSIATTLANSGATAGSYGDSVAQTPAYGATFKVPYITVDSKGRVTAISEHTVKIPASDNTNTLNTAGSTNSTSKLFLIGATSQAANPTTNSYQYTYTNNGLLSALKLGLNLNGIEKAHLEWNNDDQTLDFVFA